MSQCPNCGSKFESGKFRCSNCGALLVYGGSSGQKTSLWSKVAKYKSVLILLALAAIIASTRAFVALNMLLWVFVAGIVTAVLVFWLRGRMQAGSFQKNRFGNRPGGGGYSPPRSYRPGSIKKPANVIPFKKKKNSTKVKIKQDKQ